MVDRVQVMLAVVKQLGRRGAVRNKAMHAGDSAVGVTARCREPHLHPVVAAIDVRGRGY